MKSFRVILLLLFWGVFAKAVGPYYVCTCADSTFFPFLINLINSVHRYNFDQLGELAVFNLGLTKDQVSELSRIEKISVHEVEQTHPDLFKHFDTRPDRVKRVRGWYAWKPVALKQALELFPYMVYMDSGMMVLGPIDELFEHIWKHGYLLTGSGWSIKWMTTKHVIKIFDLLSSERNWILDESVESLHGAFFGLTREWKNDFIMPLYELAHDLRHFMDDGTTPNGFGTGRHDQTLFSIQARLLGMEWSSWRDQPQIKINGKMERCVYKDIIIRTLRVLDPRGCPEKIREHIRYRP